MQNPNDPQNQGQYPPPQYPPAPQYPAQPQYPPPQVPYVPPPMPVGPQNNSMALISLITGLGAFIVPYILSIVAIITGNKARGEIRLSNGMQTGDGMAKAGIIMGWVSMAVWSLCLCVGVALPILLTMASVGSSR